MDVFDDVVDDVNHAIETGTINATMKLYGRGLMIALLFTLVSYTIKFVTGGGLTNVINSDTLNMN